MKTRLVKADWHNHLRTGADLSSLNFNEIIDLSKERGGPGAILGIVNFDDKHYEQFAEKPGYERIDLGNGLYIPEKDVLAVKGEEVATNQGHLIILGLRKNEHPEHGRDLEETIINTLPTGAVIIADHPFCGYGIGKKLNEIREIRGIIQHSGYLSKIDGIEVHNGEASLSLTANKRAKEFYEVMSHWFPELGAVISSDGHSLREMFTSYTTVEMPEDYNEIKSPYLLNDILKKAIQSHRDFSGKMSNSRLMALVHLLSAQAYARGLIKNKKIEIKSA